jgi:hypothetical protein
MMDPPFPLRLGHFLLQRCAIQRLEEFERAEQVFGDGHDRAEVLGCISMGQEVRKRGETYIELAAVAARQHFSSH